MSQSYIPLYRKYRPQTFADLVGQEVVSKALCNAIEADKISHAYLFTGSRGTGKTSAARILAKSLNCVNGPTATPCGVCHNCTDITNGSAIDVQEIDAASNNGVEDARDIIEKVQFVPVSGKYKIFIIDEVHMLSKEAFNALLKTIEEPPKNLVFILATTESHKVLETIVSRCQRFDFRKIKIKDITKRLEYISKQEKIKITPQAIELIAQKSSGGLRDAIALLDQASVLGTDGNEITVDDILSISGALSQDDLYAITDSLAKKQPEVLIELIEKIVNQGNEPLLVLKELTEYFRNMLLIKNIQDASKLSDLVVISENYVDKIKDQSEYFETIEIAQILEKMAEYDAMLKNTTNQMMWLEVILVSILHRQDIKVLKDLEKRVSDLEAMITGGQIKQQPQPIRPTLQQPAPIAEIKPAPVSEQKIAPLPVEKITEPTVQEEPKTKPIPAKEETSSMENKEDLKEVWTNIVNLLESFPSKRFFMDLAKPVEISKDGILLALANEALIKGAKESKKIHELEAAAQKFFSQEVKVNLITFEDRKEIKKKLKQEHKKEVVSENTIQIQTEESFDIEFEELAQVKTQMPAPTPSKGFSDQTDMIIDLFQGKVID
ncbi:MAG: DNA polymerase III subunit gamma/tau [Candidatus Gastranaerophilales bacterium]|nr:DNA polymerase III subunit gamma/tau [Candidatus Gastranaerophilales bacterium]